MTAEEFRPIITKMIEERNTEVKQTHAAYLVEQAKKRKTLDENVAKGLPNTKKSLQDYLAWKAHHESFTNNVNAAFAKIEAQFNNKQAGSREAVLKQLVQESAHHKAIRAQIQAEVRARIVERNKAKVTFDQ